MGRQRERADPAIDGRRRRRWPRARAGPPWARASHDVRRTRMSSLTVWKFPTPFGAESALTKLGALQTQQLITVQDAAVVSWEAGKKKPKTRQLHDTKKGGALGGGFWGLLFGLIFFVPILGLAIGAASGALFGSLADVGISDAFIDSVRGKVKPGHSPL